MRRMLGERLGRLEVGAREAHDLPVSLGQLDALSRGDLHGELLGPLLRVDEVSVAPKATPSITAATARGLSRRHRAGRGAGASRACAAMAARGAGWRRGALDPEAPSSSWRRVISASFARLLLQRRALGAFVARRLGGAADVAHHVHHHGHALLHVVVAGRAHHADDARWARRGRRSEAPPRPRPRSASTSGCVIARTVSRMPTTASPS
jgi:hypothetical protein